MRPATQWLSEKVGTQPWIISLVVIAVITMIVYQIAQFILRQATKAADRSSNVWDDALLQAAGGPVLLATWLVGGGFMARVLQSHSEDQFLEHALALRDLAFVGCVAWFLLRFVGKVGHNVLEARATGDTELDRTTVDALSKLARLIVVIVTVVIFAQTLGFQIGGLLALGGVGGLAVGLAAKDLLANFFGGLTIYLDRPFSVGEWIRSPDKSIEGTVEYISWRHTRVRAFNKNPIYVPNAVFTTIVVENPSRMTNRRINETIGLRYADLSKVATVVADIEAMLRAHPDIDGKQTLIVNFLKFGESSLDLMIYTFTKTIVWTEYHAVKQDVLLKIADIIERHGAEIAFPTRTLHVANEQEDVAAPSSGSGASS